MPPYRSGASFHVYRGEQGDSAAGLYAAGYARAATDGQVQLAEQGPAPESGVGVVECAECLAGCIDHSQGVIGKAKAVRSATVKAAMDVVLLLRAIAPAIFGGSHLGDGQNARSKQILFHKFLLLFSEIPRHAAVHWQYMPQSVVWRRKRGDGARGKNKKSNSCELDFLAEGVGFEPT